MGEGGADHQFWEEDGASLCLGLALDSLSVGEELTKKGSMAWFCPRSSQGSISGSRHSPMFIASCVSISAIQVLKNGCNSEVSR